MSTLDTYIEYFSALRRAPGPIWSEATQKRAPHKPILLLAVLDLVARGVITSPFFDVTGDLVELNDLFYRLLAAHSSFGTDQQYRFPFFPSAQ